VATWVLTGGPVSAAGANIAGPIPLSGAQPADYDWANVTSIAVSYDVVISGIGDDSVIDYRNGSLENDSAQRVATTLVGTATRTADGTYPTSYSVAPGLFATSPTGMQLAPNTAAAAVLTEFSANMKNDGGTTTIQNVTVTITYTPPTGPVASFTADKTTLYTGQQVQFTDTSLNNPNTWSWDFDGGAAGSSQQNPLVTFNTPGVYNVVLTASNAGGSDPSDPTAITVLVREAEIWNGSAWVGGESWNGSAWVTPEVWDGTQWIPVKAP
jgi:PKD repeat protein